MSIVVGRKKNKEAFFQGQNELKLKPSAQEVDEKEEAKKPRSGCVHSVSPLSTQTGVHHMSFTDSDI